MAFAFSLDAVLRIRRMVEEREERLLHQIVLEIAQSAESLERTNSRIVESYATMGQGVTGQMTGKPAVGHEIHAAYGEVRALIDTRKELEGRLEKLEQLRDKQRAIYDVAHKEREMLTDLEQESRNAYDMEVVRREQKVLDDNYISRRGRR